jgi:hypothetical protein
LFHSAISVHRFVFCYQCSVRRRSLCSFSPVASAVERATVLYSSLVSVRIAQSQRRCLVFVCHHFPLGPCFPRMQLICRSVFLISARRFHSLFPAGFFLPGHGSPVSLGVFFSGSFGGAARTQSCSSCSMSLQCSWSQLGLQPRSVIFSLH